MDLHPIARYYAPFDNFTLNTDVSVCFVTDITDVKNIVIQI
jgi:hypothetical protein